jgi:hypothetical protein
MICVSDFCCENHVDDSYEVRLECIRHMNEFIDFIVSNSVIGDEFGELSLL